VCASHITHFSGIFSIIHILPCVFLVFLYCQFSYHISGPTLWVSHFLFGDFIRHIPGSTVGISHFSRFSLFLAIFQVIQCFWLIFNVFKFSCHNPVPTVCISHI
jgi:hypothetical protein